MGRVVDTAFGFDSKTSPRRAVLERAQADLRQEYDVREERIRELEYLEQGGDLLDFKFGSAVLASIHSTSLTDQLIEQEAKGSFALVTSPHGDSVESSGRLGPPLCREPNTGDNISLFDSGHSNLDREKNGKHSGKRKNITLSVQTPKLDEGHNKKDPEESVFIRLGVKSQAYTRRNRSKKTRDGAHTGSASLTTSLHVNRSSHSGRSNTRDAKDPLWETQLEDNAVSSICKSKPANPYCTNVTRALASDEPLEMELNAVQAHEVSMDVLKVVVSDSVPDVKISKHLQGNVCRDQNCETSAKQCPNEIISESSDLIATRVETVSADLVCAPSETTEIIDNFINAGAIRALSISNKDVTEWQNGDQINGNCDVNTLADVLTSDVMETQHSNANAGDYCSMSPKFDNRSNGDSEDQKMKFDNRANGDSEDQKTVCEGTLTMDTNAVNENSDLSTFCVQHICNNKPRSVDLDPDKSAIPVKNEVNICDNRTDIQSGERPVSSIEDMKVNGEHASKIESLLDNSLDSNIKASCAKTITPSNSSSPVHELSDAAPSRKDSKIILELQTFTGDKFSLAKKAHEDSILKEAWIIEAKLKRINQLSAFNAASEKQRKSHWDYVLEEMAWLANDFMQERLWKTTAASQICHGIASFGRSKFVKENLCRKQIKAARSVAKAIMNFWHSAEVLRTGSEPISGMHKECNPALFRSWNVNGGKSEKQQDGEKSEEVNCSRALQVPILSYAVRFLKYNSSVDHSVLAEAPTTPERIFDAGAWVVPWEDQSSEESLFYTVPAGAMHVYWKSIESHKKRGNNKPQEDSEASACDSWTEYGIRENASEEDEAETDICYMPRAIEGNKSSKFAHKKKKTLQQKLYTMRSCELGSDLPHGSCLESKLGTQPSLSGKRPLSTLNVGSIPTKRIRTASRQRVVGPFTAGTTLGTQIISKTDASSGDTSSLQDDQSALQGGYQTRKNPEIESTADLVTQMPFDGNDIFSKSKKNKKPYLGHKNSLNSACSFIASGKGSSYEQGGHVDSMVQQEEKDHSRKRLETGHFDSNGNTGIYGQHVVKKAKLLKHLPEVVSETITLVSGSIPSPAASQMSNMSNTNKLIKMIVNRDRGRKSKAVKMAVGWSGSGSSWSLFEDQALVVLVHDMGPNWELVSDAINSTVQFKCIFRKAEECKERHKILMDRNAGDGADSADDSGSSQPYPSTLPGIPKGSARQLFQRLQGPMEEDTLKEHFEKIILISQQFHSHRSQNVGQEPKQATAPHNSHILALSQACPNNLTGGAPLTPHDFYDAITSSEEVISLGYQGSHTNGVPIPSHQGSVAPVLPTSGTNSMLQGSPGRVMSNSSSSSMNTPTRNSPRYGGQRLASIPVDDQQRSQQCNHIISGRNIQQSSMSMPGALPSGIDRRMLAGGNGVGMMCGMNRGMPIPRAGFHGIPPPGVLNKVSSGRVLSPIRVGMPSTVNIYANAVPGLGTSTLRQRDALQMPQPSQNPEDRRQMVMQELQLQVTQGNGQVIAPLNGMNAPFCNQTVPPPVQTFPTRQQQQQHQMPQQPHMLGNPHHPQMQGTSHASPQQQAYAMRLAKERHQRLLHQHHQFSGSTATPPQQNGSQIQQQVQSSPPVTPMASSQDQPQQQYIPHNLHTGGGTPNQMMKQRQRQQLQQQQPRHQQQRQQSQEQAKLVNLGRGKMLMHKNLAADASHVNGLSTTPGKQVSDNNLLEQGQGMFSGSSGSTPTISQPPNQKKVYPRSLPSSSSPMPPTSPVDPCNQGQVQVPINHAALVSQPPSLPSSLPSASQQLQPQRQTNQSQQPAQRIILQQKRCVISDGQIQSTSDQVQVKQTVPTTTIIECTDSVSAMPVVTSARPSASQWKSEPSHDANTPAPISHLDHSPQHSLVETEPAMMASSQGLAQRQLSGSLPGHGHGIGGQWQQPQQLQQQPPQPQHQQHHRQAGRGSIYARPSDSGPG